MESQAEAARRMRGGVGPVATRPIRESAEGAVAGDADRVKWWGELLLIIGAMQLLAGLVLLILGFSRFFEGGLSLVVLGVSLLLTAVGWLAGSAVMRLLASAAVALSRRQVG